MKAMKNVSFKLDGVGKWKISVPPSVYPPREDSYLLCKTIAEFKSHGGNALEIGCGSGIVSIVLSSLGWDVTCCDINPVAVDATRKNLERNNLADRVQVIESSTEGEISIPEETDLIVWNIPYLEPDGRSESGIDSMENAATIDIYPDGWGSKLLQFLSENNNLIPSNILVILVLKTDPEGPSKISDWSEKGWSHRSLNYQRFVDEKIEVIGFWKTGSGIEPVWLETCSSTMDEAKKIVGKGWHRVGSEKQTDGRGRRGSKWESVPGSLFATWKIDGSILDELPPGIVQTSIGAAISRILGSSMKWPNDIMSKDWKKIGGVLLESEDMGDLHAGVGLNRHKFVKGRVEGEGWNEELGNIGGREVFGMIDAEISSIFENVGMLNFPSKERLISLSWEALSGLLSCGIWVKIMEEELRVVGLNGKGEIEALGIDGIEIISDLDSIEWIILSDA